MKLKPAIVLDMVTILGKKAESYVDESDTMVIEDQSGRIKIQSSEAVNPKNFVTGTVIALKGKITQNGFFKATDYTYCGVPVPPSVGESAMISDDSKPTPLF